MVRQMWANPQHANCGVWHQEWDGILPQKNKTMRAEVWTKLSTRSWRRQCRFNLQCLICIKEPCKPSLSTRFSRKARVLFESCLKVIHGDQAMFLITVFLFTSVWLRCHPSSRHLQIWLLRGSLWSAQGLQLLMRAKQAPSQGSCWLSSQETSRLRN